MIYIYDPVMTFMKLIWFILQRQLLVNSKVRQHAARGIRYNNMSGRISAGLPIGADTVYTLLNVGCVGGRRGAYIVVCINMLLFFINNLLFT